MRSINSKQPQSGVIFMIYEFLLRIMGNKRYYPEIQQIESRIAQQMSSQEAIHPDKIALIGIFKLLFTTINRLYQKLFWIEQWYLLIDPNNSKSKPFDEYKPIIPPSDRFWADPHIIQLNNIAYIFVEEYIYQKRKACISVIEVDAMGNYKNPITVLENEQHLSYPYIFSYQDKYYMIPESSESRTIDLYQCTGFPNDWRFVMHLMTNVVAVDTTLFYYSNKWWLFTAMPEKSESLPKVKLFLFYSDDFLSGSWVSHPQNPVISDPASARPAGKIYMIDHKIYRPSQDTHQRYGNGIYINEIYKLSESEYHEKRYVTIKADWDKKILGTHTYTCEGQFSTIDVYRRLSRFSFLR